MLYHADVVQWLKKNQWLVENGFIPKYHAVFADPPYGLAFMNADWDTHSTPQQFQSWVTEWARLMLSFVHPGGLLVMAGGTRTYHRLAAGLEDAGWEIADSLAVWGYGSGFPKSMAIDLAIDKQMGLEREVVGQKAVQGGWHHDHLINDDGWKGGTQHIPAPAAAASARWQGYGTALKPSFEPYVIARAPRTGYTYADLALTFGSGAIHVDGGRVGTDAVKTQGGQKFPNLYGTYKDAAESWHNGRFPANTLFTCECDGVHADGCPIAILDAQSGILTSGEKKAGTPYNHSNAVTMGKSSGAVTRDFPSDSGGASRFFYQAKASAWEREAGLTDFELQDASVGDRRPSGSMSQRIHKEAERPDTLRRNIHPTVKPITLCTYLAKLILPPPLDMPRRLLVPFAGVGSEMIGAHFAGWDEIDGVELTAEYIPINEARRKWWEQFTSYEQAERAAKRKPKTAPKAKAENEQMSLFAA